VREVFFRDLPLPLKLAFFTAIRRKVARDLNGQGTGRRSREELLALFASGMRSIAVRLGDAPFFFGDEPRSVDTALFGLLENAIAIELDGPFEEIARSHDDLRADCDRMRARLYPVG
jgi:glutathione S-transferase